MCIRDRFEVTPLKKRWGLIFTCMTTRAVHLEDVDGPGADPFCKALKRFMGRRRRPDCLRSDRGTAFVNLAEQEKMTEAAYAELLEDAAVKNFRIDLRFNPPGAPHWGGAWERMIKEIKKILKASHQSVKKMKPDEFRTFLVRAEAILNRRPIACLLYTSDAADE